MKNMTDTGSAPLRLTRRGRVVACLVLGFTAVVVVLGVANSGAFADSAPASDRRVVVHAGDTVSDLLVKHAPHYADSAGVARVVELNNLDGARVYPGQLLTLPQ